MAVRFPDIPQTVNPVEIHMNYCFDHMITCIYHGTPGLHYPNGVAIDSNNQIYVAEGYYCGKLNPSSIARVLIFSETGEFLNTFSHPHMREPCGIAIHRDNVYVTDKFKHFLFHFKVEAYFRLVSRIGSRGSGVGQFDEPRQLAVSTSGDVFVADFFNNRVQILDSDLHYQRDITHHSMKRPLDVKLTQDEVYICRQSSPDITVFSYTGDLIRSIILRGVFGMLVIPPFFCLDADGNLLICDRNCDSIKIFSKEGSLLHTSGIRMGMLCGPHGIALTNSLKLVVVSENSFFSLRIFSSN